MVLKSLDIACTWSRFLEGRHQKPGGGCGKVVYVRNLSLPSPFLSVGSNLLMSLHQKGNDGIYILISSSSSKVNGAMDREHFIRYQVNFHIHLSPHTPKMLLLDYK